jgi:hypothetical protein
MVPSCGAAWGRGCGDVQGFSWFRSAQVRMEGHFSDAENGMSKKNLPQLISIVNLGTL